MLRGARRPRERFAQGIWPAGAEAHCQGAEPKQIVGVGLGCQTINF